MAVGHNAARCGRADHARGAGAVVDRHEHMTLERVALVAVNVSGRCAAGEG
jgi:hypothetical protein